MIDDRIEKVRKILMGRINTLENKSEILKSKELGALFSEIPKVAVSDRAEFGKAVNQLQADLKKKINENNVNLAEKAVIDVTAPLDINYQLPKFIDTANGTIHPISSEIARIVEIFSEMGFSYFESREIDDQFHMFESLNFPKGHPARDDWDTFMTIEKDKDGEAFIAPAHTSTMQNRIMVELGPQLDLGNPVAAVVIDRVFRNEDLDPRHEHTFYQCEGIYIDKNLNVGMLVATLKVFLETYYQKHLEVRINPFYFPFTEPSFEFSLSCPFCDKAGCNICSYSGWIELLGCGMIHPNVLKSAGIDQALYSGFAWGYGVERLIMMKYGIEDIRHFESSKLDFLRQF